MAFDFPTVEVREGRARLLVPDAPRQKGPGTRGTWPFYNPTMVVNRDLGAIILARWPRPLRTALDGLAGTGVWGIRMVLEGRVASVAFNDRNEEACRLIEANLKRNDIVARVTNAPFTEVVRGGGFGFVDIDPFGSPRPFLEDAIRHADGAIGLGITATDTAALSGTYPETCVRRYGARSLRCRQGHEIGLRILIGYAARFAAACDKTVHPLLSFSAEHFLRAYLDVRRRGPGPDAMPIGHVVRSSDGRFVPVEPEPEAIGPLWLGSLSDAGFLERLAPSDSTQAPAARLLDRLRAEAGMPAFFLSTEDLAARSRGSPPRVERFLQALRGAGYRATRTHFDPQGVATEAPYDEALRIYRACMPG